MLSNTDPNFWLLQDLYRAYLLARRRKGNTTNCLNFRFEADRELLTLFHELLTRTYTLSSSIAFVVNDPTRREIFAATFRDRVIHHLVYNYIMPYWDARFIYDSYSCRPGKGTHFGIERVSRFMREASLGGRRPAWVLKLDISGYFMHINRLRMWQFNRRALTDPRLGLDRQRRDLLYYLLPIIIFGDPTLGARLRGFPRHWVDLPPGKSLYDAPVECGFPIGNLTSQLFSNIYLHELDKFIKYRLGMKYYGRYVDDFVMVSANKNELLMARARVTAFLRDQLELRLHPNKVYLQPVTHGVNFIGARIFPDRIEASQRLVKHQRQFVKQSASVHQDKNWRAKAIAYQGHVDKYKRMSVKMDYQQ